MGVDSVNVIIGNLEAIFGEKTDIFCLSFLFGTFTVDDENILYSFLDVEVLAKRGDPPILKSYNFDDKLYLSLSSESADYGS